MNDEAFWLLVFIGGSLVVNGAGRLALLRSHPDADKQTGFLNSVMNGGLPGGVLGKARAKTFYQNMIGVGLIVLAGSVVLRVAA